MKFRIPELFETQRNLDAEIEKIHPTEKLERIEKKFLALFTELGECSNEWRGFKFWSNDQKPRTKVGMGLSHPGQWRNPLLEEYVDPLHFLLSLGLEFGFENIDFQQELKEYEKAGITFKEPTITRQFNNIFYLSSQLEADHQESDFVELLLIYIALGEMLGFDWQQVEDAYHEKNAVNHKRQETGY